MATGEQVGLEQQVEFLSSLVQAGPLYSSSEGQRECARLIASKLDDFGWDRVDIQPYTARQLTDDEQYVPVESFGEIYEGDLDRPKENVIAVLEASNPGKTVILNGHYDIEPIADVARWEGAWNSGEIRGGRVWGRGSTDMLGGLSSQLFIASELAANRDKWAGRIIFNAVADEEVGGNGTLASLRYLRDEGLLSGDDTTCLIAEPSDRVIALESLGFLHMALRAEGVARHMAGAALRDNVLYDLIDVISGFEDTLTEAATAVNPAVAKLQHAFGIIAGGTDAATPMDTIESEATIFYPVDTPAGELKQSIIEKISRKKDRVKTSFSDFYFDGQRSESGALTEALYATRPNKAFKTGIFPSPCDARLFGHFGVAEVITYGPGSLSQAHTANEYIEIRDIDTYNGHLRAALARYLTKDK